MTTLYIDADACSADIGGRMTMRDPMQDLRALGLFVQGKGRGFGYSEVELRPRSTFASMTTVSHEDTGLRAGPHRL